MRQQHQAPTPSAPARRRPAWNSYLTDGAQYRLNEHQQLTRQLQQLSTVHFSSRSPATQQIQRRSATPKRYSNNTVDNTANSSYQYASVAGGSNATPVTALRERPGSSDSARRRKIGASVSFKLDHEEHDAPTPSQKVNLQGELATLERMLVELEVETATLNQEELQAPPARSYTYELSHDQVSSSYQHDDENGELYVHPEVEYSDDRAASDDDEDQFDSEGEEQSPDTSRQQQQTQSSQDPESPGNTSSLLEEDVKLSQVCYKSLSIGMHLAKKMDQLSRELELERKARVDHELKIEVLEQVIRHCGPWKLEVRSTRAKCNYLDAKYQSVLSQVDDMREALIATEEAVHRLTKHAAERSRPRASHRHGSTAPTTPKQTREERDYLAPRSMVANGFHEQDSHSTARRSRSATTPKRSPKTGTPSHRLREGGARQQQQENDAGLLNTNESSRSRR